MFTKAAITGGWALLAYGALNLLIALAGSVLICRRFLDQLIHGPKLVTHTCCHCW